MNGESAGIQEYETPIGNGPIHRDRPSPPADDEAIERTGRRIPTRPELYTEAGRVIATYKDEYWIVGVTVTTIFETAWALRGLEQIMMDFVVNPDLVERILDIPDSYHLAAAKRSGADGGRI